MSDKDIAVGVTTIPHVIGSLTKKPIHLIKLSLPIFDSSFLSPYFITMDNPELTSNFIKVKGLFVNKSCPIEYDNSSNPIDGQIIEKFNEILSNADKNSFCEMMFPNHQIVYIRSLVFRAK